MEMNSASDNATVSVIIVSWNACNYLRKCLASLSPESCRYPLEIIVVDNASSDGSDECVEREFPHVRLIRNDTNLGFAKANNIGIRQSRGRYLALINSDVVLMKDCLSRLVDYCEQHREVGMAGPRVIGGDGRLQRSCRGFPSVWNMFCRAAALDTIFPKCRLFTGYSLMHWPQDTLRPVDILTGCFWLARRQALGQVGLLDETFFMYGEDMDWCKRFWKHGWPLMFVPAAEAIHYGGASSSNSPVRFHVEMQRADLQYWGKHHSSAAKACYLLVAILHMALRVVGFSLALCSNRREYDERKHKMHRSLACLKWMISNGIKGPGRLFVSRPLPRSSASNSTPLVTIAPN